MKGVYFNLDLTKIQKAKNLGLIQYKNDWPIPEIEYPNQVRVKTLMGGICGTDLHQLFLELSPIDYFRVDFRFNEKEKKLFMLEVNVCCNLGSHASFVFSINKIGLKQVDLINHILAFSIRRQGALRK